MELLGHLERFASSIYPLRWFIATGTFIVLACIGIVGVRRRWHRVVLRRPLLSAAFTVAVLAVTIPIGYVLLSPLWTRTMLDEASPLVAAAGRETPTPSATTIPLPTPMTAPTQPADRTPVPDVASTSTSTLPTSPSTSAASDPTATPEPVATAAVPAPNLEPTMTAEPVVEPSPTPEPEPPAFEPHITHTGEFFGADEFHFGRGTALIIEVEPGIYVLRFEDFSVRNGPDLRVYLSTNPDGASANDFYVGELKATDGAFNYDLPAGLDLTPYRSVIIWCEPFAVLFATAPLTEV